MKPNFNGIYLKFFTQNSSNNHDHAPPFSFSWLDIVRNRFSSGLPVSIKAVDSSKLSVCHIKREFGHKVAKRIAAKSKGSMGWFYGFKLHIIVNQLMEILEATITPGNKDDREGMALIWNHIFGLIVADAGYVGAKPSGY